MISKFIVLTRPKPGREQEYNDWYDNQHLGDMLSFPGFIDAQRFKFTHKINDVDHWEYGAIYSIEGDDPKLLVDAVTASVAAGDVFVSPAMDNVVYAAVYEPIGELTKA